MLMRQMLDMYDLLDRADASGALVAQYLQKLGGEHVAIKTMKTEEGSTDFIKVLVPGQQGKTAGGTMPTLGVLGRLGGLGARPGRLGFVSDGDGALAALTVAAKLIDMQAKGDVLEGDVIVATHICPDAPTEPHDPVPFMGSPVSMEACNEEEVDAAMDAILSIDTTKGNEVVCHNGFTISPTVQQGYILKVSQDLMDIMKISTGRLPVVFPLSQQDITPYGNGLTHINSILQPAVVAKVPVVGVAITTEVPVPGCGTGASHAADIEAAARYCLEVAKSFTQNACQFSDEGEFALLQKLYGGLTQFQTMGKGS